MEKFLITNPDQKRGLVRNQIFDSREIAKVPLSARVAYRHFRIPKVSLEKLKANLGDTVLEGHDDEKEDSQKKPQDKLVPIVKDEVNKPKSTLPSIDEEKDEELTSDVTDKKDEPTQKPCVKDEETKKTGGEEEECSDTCSSTETSSTSSSSSSSEEDSFSDTSTSSSSFLNTEEYAEKTGNDTFGYPVISVSSNYLLDKSKQEIAEEKRARREERRKKPLLSIFGGKPLDLCNAGLKYLEGKCDDNQDGKPKVIRQTKAEYERNMAAFRVMRRKEWEKRQKRRELRKDKLKKERELEETLDQKETKN